MHYVYVMPLVEGVTKSRPMLYSRLVHVPSSNNALDLEHLPYSNWYSLEHNSIIQFTHFDHFNFCLI